MALDTTKWQVGSDGYVEWFRPHVKYQRKKNTRCAFPVKDSGPVVEGSISVRNKRRRVLNKGSSAERLDIGHGSQETGMRARRVAQRCG
uniref:Uncharacterized protein n=1 Tax=Tanacetum cinerariifolium TaxID=118510 RepID=A0A6L2KT20_TANCI|nr:hypothetical protein [Tanacetum cinerariifolium]